MTLVALSVKHVNEDYNRLTMSPDDEMVSDDFYERWDDDFSIQCNIVSVLPVEYDYVSGVSEDGDETTYDKATNQKPLYYYVTNNDVVKEQQSIFERPILGMMYHLEPLLIRAKMDSVAVNKVFVNTGVVVNLMPQSLVRKIGKFNTNLRPQNMVLLNYAGKPIIFWEWYMWSCHLAPL